VNDLVEFYNYEVVTTVKTEYDQPTEFPAISFCSYQQNIYDTYFPLIKNLNVNTVDYDSDKGVKKDPGNHHESYISPYYGRCFRFNSGKNITNHSIPIKYSYSGGYFDVYYLSIYAPNGLIIWIHNKSSLTLMRRDMIYISSNITTFIEFERTFESKLEEPYNYCLKDVFKFKKNKTLIYYFLDRNLSYSQQNCLGLCFEFFYIKENPCECKQPELGKVFENCWLVEEKFDFSSCTWNYMSEFQKDDLIEKFSDYCLLECDLITFSYSI